MFLCLSCKRHIRSNQKCPWCGPIKHFATLALAGGLVSALAACYGDATTGARDMFRCDPSGESLSLSSWYRGDTFELILGFGADGVLASTPTIHDVMNVRIASIQTTGDGQIKIAVEVPEEEADAGADAGVDGAADAGADADAGVDAAADAGADADAGVDAGDPNRIRYGKFTLRAEIMGRSGRIERCLIQRTFNVTIRGNYVESVN